MVSTKEALDFKVLHSPSAPAESEPEILFLAQTLVSQDNDKWPIATPTRRAEIIEERRVLELKAAQKVLK